MNWYADKKVNRSTEILLQNHRSIIESYSSAVMPHSPRAMSNTQESLQLSHPVLTPLLTGSATIPSSKQQQQSSPSQSRTQSQQQQLLQQQLVGSLVPLRHEQQQQRHNSNNSITTLYTSLESAPKKRKHNQHGLIHVKQVYNINISFIIRNRK